MRTCPFYKRRTEYLRSKETISNLAARIVLIAFAALPAALAWAVTFSGDPEILPKGDARYGPSANTDDSMATAIATAIVDRAKDPTSVRFMSLGTPDGTQWCVVYSATNSFNARVTSQWYYSEKTKKGSASPAIYSKRCTGVGFRKDYSEAMNQAVFGMRKKLGLP